MVLFNDIEQILELCLGTAVAVMQVDPTPNPSDRLVHLQEKRNVSENLLDRMGVVIRFCNVIVRLREFYDDDGGDIGIYLPRTHIYGDDVSSPRNHSTSRSGKRGGYCAGREDQSQSKSIQDLWRLRVSKDPDSYESGSLKKQGQ